jgi:O-antigen/teichoic acid export membrane protein
MARERCAVAPRLKGLLQRHGLVLGRGAWMIGVTVLTGMINFAASAVFGRMLGPVGFGVYSSMTVVVTVVTMASGVLQTATTRQVAVMAASGEEEGIGPLLLLLTRRAALSCLALSAVMVALASPITRVLRLGSWIPVVVTASVIIPVAVVSLLVGGLHGRERFGDMGLVVVFKYISRLLLGVIFIGLGLGASGALAAAPLSGVIGLLLAAYWQRDHFRRHDLATPVRPAAVSGWLRSSAPVLVGMTSGATLFNLDLLLSKARFAPRLAGLYAAVAALGRVPLYLSYAIGAVVLPRTSARSASRTPTGPVLRAGLGATAVLIAPVHVLYYLFPGRLLGALFGPSYVELSPLLGHYGLALSALSLANICLVHALGNRDWLFPGAVLAMLTVVAGAQALIPTPGPGHMVALMGGAGVVLLGIGVVRFFRR